MFNYAMPVSVRKIGPNQYQVRTPSGVRAKNTTKSKARKQAKLLRAIDHGWQPTGHKLARENALRLVRRALNQAAIL